MSSKNKIVHHSASDANIKQPQEQGSSSFPHSELSPFDKLIRTGSRFKVALVEKANEAVGGSGLEVKNYLKYPSHSQIYNPSMSTRPYYQTRDKKISCPVSVAGSPDYSDGIFVLPRSPENFDSTSQKGVELMANKQMNNFNTGSIELTEMIDDAYSYRSSSSKGSRTSSILLGDVDDCSDFSKSNNDRKKDYIGNKKVKIMSDKKALDKEITFSADTNDGPISISNQGIENDKTETGSTYHKKMMTYETLPNVEHYKNIFSMVKTRGRPSLTELHERPRVPEFFQENEEDNGYYKQGAGGGDAYVFSRQHTSKDYLGGSTGRQLGEKERGISQGPKFGWIKGVLVRCLLNIWGVMLFLRLSWVVGQSGIGLATVIVLLSVTVTTISSMSMSAICTNGDVKGGGAYYMISRSLGPEFGGAIGIIFSLANAVAVAMYIVGFAETVVDLISRHAGTLFNISPTNWIRIIGCGTAVLLLAISMAGMEWEAKAQLGLLFLLVVAIINYLIGTFLPPNDTQKAKGYFGFKSALFKQNFVPAFTVGENFFSVFSIFFPAATGILAGANISGDLKNAQKAIPRGTFLAILITTIVYLLLIWTLGSTVIRQASGDVNDLYSFIKPTTLSATLGVTGQNIVKTLWPDSVILSPTESPISSCRSDSQGDHPSGKCPYGLLNDYQVVDMISLYAPITTIGIFAATLSSALASLVGAPKVFQALCRDNLFPGLRFFAVGSKKNDEPYRAYVLAFTISVLCILIAELNVIAPIISNFFLMAYALINYSCFDASMSKSIGFRPGFKYFNRWVSLFGGCLCVVTMFLIKWWAAFITFFFVIFFYIYIRYKKPDVNWGSSTQAHSYKSALTSILKLNNTEEHVKNFRPQILVLAGDPRSRPAFLDFVNNFTKNISLLICGHVILGHSTDLYFNVDTHGVYSFLKHRKIKALYNVVVAPTLRTGVKSLIQLSGLGRLRPNILMMGYKNNWESDDMESLNQYFNIIHDAFDMRYGVGILRLRDGLDYSFYTTQHQLLLLDGTAPLDDSDPHPDTPPTPQLHHPDPLDTPPPPPGSALPRHLQRIWSGFMVRSVSSIVSADYEPPAPLAPPPLRDAQGSGHMGLSILRKLSARRASGVSADGRSQRCERNRLLTPQSSEKRTRKDAVVEPPKSPSAMYKNEVKQGSGKRSSRVYNKNILSAINQFHRKQRKGTIDVWWLFDDGGLTILLPYIISQRRNWENCKMRFFALSKNKRDLDIMHHNFGAMLTKFRIDYSDVIILPDIHHKPNPEGITAFQSLIAKYRVKDENDSRYRRGMITDAEYAALEQKTFRHIRLHEMLNDYSSDANLIVITLPMPRKGTCSAALYMGWLEIMTRNLPPILLLRGNQQSVLTFYS